MRPFDTFILNSSSKLERILHQPTDANHFCKANSSQVN
jgi:hypothetical protein